MDAAMTIEDLTHRGYRYHHSALRATYCSRRTPYTIRPYSGRFGTGYMVLYPNPHSNNFSPCDYYVQ